MSRIHRDKQYETVSHSRAESQYLVRAYDKKTRLTLTLSNSLSSFCSVLDVDGKSVRVFAKVMNFGKCVNSGCVSVTRGYCFNFSASQYPRTPEMFIEFFQHSYCLCATLFHTQFCALPRPEKECKLICVGEKWKFE